MKSFCWFNDILFAYTKSMQEVQNAFHKQFGSENKDIFSDTPWGYTFFAFVLTVVIAGLWYYERFYLRRKKKGLIDNPGSLFRQLCQAHELEGKKRNLLKRIAQQEQVEEVLRLFVEPMYLRRALGGAYTPEEKERIQELLDQLFNEPKRSEEGGDSSNDDDPDRGGGKDKDPSPNPSSPPFDDLLPPVSFDLSEATECLPEFSSMQQVETQESSPSKKKDTSKRSRPAGVEMSRSPGAHLEYPHEDAISVDPIITTLTEVTTEMASQVLKNRLLHGDDSPRPAFLKSASPRQASEDLQKRITEERSTVPSASLQTETVASFLSEDRAPGKRSATRHSSDTEKFHQLFGEKKVGDFIPSRKENDTSFQPEKGKTPPEEAGRIPSGFKASMNSGIDIFQVLEDS